MPSALRRRICLAHKTVRPGADGLLVRLPLTAAAHPHLPQVVLVGLSAEAITLTPLVTAICTATAPAPPALPSTKIVSPTLP